MTVREKRRPNSPPNRMRNPTAIAQSRVLKIRQANEAKRKMGRATQKADSPARTRLVDPHEGMSPKEVIDQRMKSWGPSLPFPFDFNDITEYDPIGAQKVLKAEQDRSERAHQEYLQTVENGKRQVEERRKQREEERRRQEERDLEREVQKLKEHRESIDLQLQEEAKKEERIKRTMERELYRVAEATQLREDLRRQEDELDEQFEQQIEALKQREREGEVFLSRRVARRQLAESILQREESMISENEQAKAELRGTMAETHQRSVAALDEAKKLAVDQMTMEEAMEKGRMMRLCGVTRADQAYLAGFINIPPPALSYS
eukprot:TRINITY_DN36826_c0_g1_i1.p1 TRINITY_DN36826_c0_g1~~TRINITY_DN36826_c0_g1_i1.p1  ORF type:complete len:319 (+),score=88.53 TRINITY_DN36826_c0_g1_i1:45-1001(+)